ncbi:MAG: hypothetical protein Q8P49_03215 [Candidatus Liptonbacteria bacterium]|nr:hypothetical protein [Candidatus Liptonbacteria bacterium]
MNKKLIRMIAVAIMLCMPLLASAQADPAWPWDKFEDQKLLTVHIVCDAGTSEYKSYLNTPHTFTGMTIKVKGGMYYMYSPNPNSMSPIVYSYIEKEPARFFEVTRSERDQAIGVAAPQLYGAISSGSMTGCTVILDGSQRKSE